MVVWGGDGGSSARAIEVRKVERKMERRVRRDRGGRGVGVSIADFFGEAAEEVNRVDAESSGIFINCPARYGLSVIARLSKTTLPHLQTSGRFSKIPSAIRTCSFGHFSGDRFATHRLQNHCVLGTIWEPLGYSHVTISEIEPHGIKRPSRGVRSPRDD